MVYLRDFDKLLKEEGLMNLDSIAKLQEEGLILSDMVNPLNYKGVDWKEASLVDWIQFSKANEPWLDPGISWWELVALHEACEQGRKPALILETGQCFGTTTRYFLIRTLKYGGDLFSIELHVRDKLKNVLEEMGLWDKINTINANSQKIFWDKYIDILFIDSEHAFSDALGEYMKYRLFLTQGSIVGFHDSKNCYGVSRTIEVIQEIDDLELIGEVPLRYGPGITLFKVKNMNSAQIRINQMVEQEELERLKRDRGEI